MPILLALLSTAHASPLTTVSVPGTWSFDFEWYSGPTLLVAGSTTYTFLNRTRYRGTQTCRDLRGCLRGDFATGNGGEGTYETEAYIENCVVTGPGAGQFGSDEILCDVTQSLEMTYDTTNALYTGTAPCGTMTADQFVIFGFPLIFNRVYSLAPGDFTGTLASPSGATGFFWE